MKQNLKKLFCLLVTVTLLLPVLVSIPLTASAATTFNVTQSSVSVGLGSIEYNGKNYKTGATGQNLSFNLNAGFLLVANGDKYWGVCAYSGAKEPSANMAMGELISLNANGVYIDGLNNTGSGSHGSHYIVNSPQNDSSWGHSRKIGMDFVFRCFYYANHLYSAKKLPTAITPNDCSLQEAIAIAYRYEWDTRLIQYGNTGVWNNSSKIWTVRDVASWTKNNTHFAGVADGNATHQAIVTAANQILVAAMQDADEISGHIQTGTLDGKTYLYYPLKSGDQCELFCVAGPARGTGQADYQDLFAYRPAQYFEDIGSIRITKVSESGDPLPWVTFWLYSDQNCTNGIERKITGSDGVATFTNLTPGTYYVKETSNLNSGYAKDATVYKAVVTAGRTTTISNNANGKFINYKPTGSWTPTARKILTGGTLKENQFTFELYNASTNEKLQTVKNKADGSVSFSPIQYTAADIGKTYEYTVKEQNTGGAYFYDTHKLTYTVKITYSASDKDKLTVSVTSSGSTTFTNEYDENYYGSIGIKKVDQFGNPLQGVVFDICLYGSDLKYATVTTNENGEAICYDIPVGDGYVPTMYFKEVSAPAGYTFDAEKIYLIHPTKGQLSWATVAPVVNQATTATWKPSVSKRLLGGTLQSGTCTFALCDEKGVQLQTVSNSGGNIPFTEITYTPADAGKTYTYTVREVSGTIENSVLDEHTLTYTVNVSMNGNVLTVNATSSGSTTFVNYVPTGSWRPGIKKELIGRDPQQDEFSVELLDENGNVIRTGWNEYSATDFWIYPPIQYTLADVGTHVYTVREKQGTDPTVAYDDHIITYTVTVAYSGTGTALTVTSTVEGSETFTNYVPSGLWQPQITKELIGRELQQDEFTFVLEKDGNVLQTVKNLADGTIPFEEINYNLSDTGKHVYTIREIKGKDTSVVYDEHVLTYTVNVSYSGAGTELLVETSVDGSETFLNDVPRAVWKPEVTKTLLGRPLQDGEFSFVLEKDGTILQTVSNLADGTIPFAELTFGAMDIGRTYIYTVRELPGDDPTVAYDDHVVTYTVSISYGLDEMPEGESRHVLQAIAFRSVSEPDQSDASDLPLEGFQNEISTPPPSAGDKGTILYVLIGIVAAITVIGIVVFFTRDGRKKKF